MSEKAERDEAQSVYDAEREALAKGEVDSEKSFDKWILTLSGGALGLSMTFLKDIVKNGPVVVGWCLFCSWMIFALSLVFILINQRIAPYAHAKYREILDEEFSHYHRDTLKLVRKRQGEIKSVTWMTRLDIASLMCFLAGIVLLSVFVYQNMKH